MANNTILVRSDDVFITVAGRRITDMPNTGTYFMIEKLSARATHVEGQHGTSVTVRNNSKSYRATLTIIQGSDDDAWMQGVIAALDAANTVTPVTCTYGKTKYVSGNCDVEVVPSRELAADGSPPVVYTLTGTWPIIKVSAFGQPTVLTEDQVAAFL